jgi:hypothetical protein
MDRVFILEIDGRPVLAFVATTLKEALELGREDWLRNDLRILKSEGVPLWDGAAKISVRIAKPDEVAAYKTDVPELDNAEELGMVFIVELDGAL